MKRLLLISSSILLIIITSISSVSANESEETNSNEFFTFDDILYTYLSPGIDDNGHYDGTKEFTVGLAFDNADISNDFNINVVIIGQNIFSVNSFETSTTNNETYLSMEITADNYEVEINGLYDFSIVDSDNNSYVTALMLNTMFYTDNGVPKVLNVVDEEVVDVVDYDITPFCDSEHAGVSENNDHICVQSIDMVLDQVMEDGLFINALFFDIDLYNYDPNKNQPYSLVGAKINGFDTETGENDAIVRNGDIMQLTISETTSHDIKMSTALLYSGLVADPNHKIVSSLARANVLANSSAAIWLGGIYGWYQGTEKVNDYIEDRSYDIDAITISNNYQNMKVITSYFGSTRDVEYEYMLEEIYYLNEYGEECALSDIDYSQSGTIDSIDSEMQDVVEQINDSDFMQWIYGNKDNLFGDNPLKAIMYLLLGLIAVIMIFAGIYVLFQATTFVGIFLAPFKAVAFIINSFKRE